MMIYECDYDVFDLEEIKKHVKMSSSACIIFLVIPVSRLINHLQATAALPVGCNL